MDILKTATVWAKDELFSTPFFVLFGMLFIGSSIGFWLLGKTELAKAYIIPTAIAGTLLIIVGVGLFFTNKSRLNQFETAYHENPSAFVTSEIERVEGTLNEYQTVVFKAIPIIIAIAALMIVFLHSPTWRAISITSIAMMIVILMIDGNAHARIKTYHQELLAAQNQKQKT